ncbi:MAG: hypothetical protein K8L99_11705 [Anaerolineae bacterium]|nr:hypothetical protein [Anaerolineae bacterium]
MARVLHFVALFLVLLVVAGCETETQDVGELPTLAVLASLTPSDTPTITPFPTSTNTPTLTLTPTITLTPTVTLTPTFTVTSTPSVTATFTITPTPTITPTFTLTPTPTASNTPINTPTPNLPQIITFGANNTNVAPGTVITLAWNTISDTTRIDQLNQQGGVVQSFSVVPAGQLPVSVPANAGSTVIYRLVAIRGGQEVSQSLPITITCSIPWFFGNENAPPGSGCPTAIGAIGEGAHQNFERGRMIYVNANGLNRIYGMTNDGNRYISYNNWSGPTEDWGSRVPPSGLYRPQGVFRQAFDNTNPPVGGDWLGVIGWATNQINETQRTIQYEQSGAFYIDIPSGGVFRFSGGDNGTWTRIK